MQKGGAGEFYSSLFSWLAIGLGQVSACLGALIHCLVKWKSHLPLQNYTVRCLLTFKHFEILKWEAILKFKSWLLFLALWVSSTWLWTLGFAKWFLIQLHEGSFFFFFFTDTAPLTETRLFNLLTTLSFMTPCFWCKSYTSRPLGTDAGSLLFFTLMCLCNLAACTQRRGQYTLSTPWNQVSGDPISWTEPGQCEARPAQVMSCTGSRGYG